MTSQFKDYFSAQAADYARYRPGYPSALFEYLAGIAPGQHLAWDAGTGSGQAAVGLADWFERVIASDASASQIQRAEPRPNVEYRVEPAENTSLENESIDLVTVGQALHWFDLPRFYAEVRRVARPGGVIAVWCYGNLECAPEIDPLLRRFYWEVVGPYWPAERRFIEEGYRSLEFPFAPVSAPDFALEAQWDRAELLGYLGTWSATQRYREARGTDPREALAEYLKTAWGFPGTKRRIKWPLTLRIGKIGDVYRNRPGRRQDQALEPS